MRFEFVCDSLKYQLLCFTLYIFTLPLLVLHDHPLQSTFIRYVHETVHETYRRKTVFCLLNAPYIIASSNKCVTLLDYNSLNLITLQIKFMTMNLKREQVNGKNGVIIGSVGRKLEKVASVGLYLVHSFL